MKHISASDCVSVTCERSVNVSVLGVSLCSGRGSVWYIEEGAVVK